MDSVILPLSKLNNGKYGEIPDKENDVSKTNWNTWYNIYGSFITK